MFAVYFRFINSLITTFLQRLLQIYDKPLTRGFHELCPERGAEFRTTFAFGDTIEVPRDKYYKRAGVLLAIEMLPGFLDDLKGET